MDIRHLRTFVTIAHLGSLTKAAETLHVTQPAISGQLKNLEEELGMKLLNRGATSMVLTPAGSDLLLRAEKTLEAFGEFLECARSQHGQVGGQLDLGVVMFDPVDIRLGAFVREITDRFPGIKLNLQSGRNSSFKESVVAGRLDGAIALSRGYDSRVAETLLQEVKFSVVAPRRWSLPAGDALLPALATLPWIRMRAGSQHHEMITEILSARRIKPIETVEADHESVIQALVAAGIGIGLLRDELAQQEARAGNVVVLDSLFATGRLVFMHAADRSGDRALAAVKECLTAAWTDKAGAVI